MDMRFETEFRSAEDYRREYDLVVATTTASTAWCAANTSRCSSPTSTRGCASSSGWARMPSSTTPFTFIFEKTEHGWVWAHVYQFDAETATSSSNACQRPGIAGALPT